MAGMRGQKAVPGWLPLPRMQITLLKRSGPTLSLDTLGHRLTAALSGQVLYVAHLQQRKQTWRGRGHAQGTGQGS